MRTLMALLIVSMSSVSWGNNSPHHGVTEKAAFIRDCAAIAPAIPGGNFEKLCRRLAQEKKPSELISYHDSIREIAADLKKWGPNIAKNLVAKCTAKAVDKQASPLELQFCLETHSFNAETLAKPAANNGVDPTKRYAALVGKVQEEKTDDSTPWSSLSEDQKSKLRRVATDACAAEAEGYIGAACAAVALHEELLAKAPYGPNGEIAKAFDKAMDAYKFANAPQEKAKEALKKLGIPEAALLTPDDVNKAAVNLVTTTTRPVEQAVSGVKDTFNRVFGTKL